MPRPMLQDLFAHLVWADAEHWRTAAALPAAREDRVLLDRLHHIHLVQRAFIWAVGDRAAPLAFSKPGDFARFEELREYAREAHTMAEALLAGVTDARLAQPVDIPWFKDPPLTLTVLEALTQCAMHSHWHRGQNAVRLRELGATPPRVDLIVWYWNNRPAPAWD